MNYKRKTSKSTEKITKKYTIDPGLKDIIRENAYIGKKGYTIPRNIITKEEEDFIHNDLFVKPEIFGAAYGADASDMTTAFPVYRENAKKMYLPRFYGINRYGLPDRAEIEPGDDINVEFPKTVRDYQTHIIKVYTDYVSRPVCGESDIMGSGGILEVPCGRGKTVMALKIISLLQKKTLILVHKEFLMNQWIERIHEFLPGASIGKIQGQVFDVENKDIVIGMIQTLYDKTYPSDTFSCFGLTIIDEVHRIGSEQFSRTLFNTITPYMLGISATVDRKDKLTRVLHMFIGDKIYEEKRTDTDPVCVRGIQYANVDPEFNETALDFRGNTKYSTMITKLCAFGPRSDFIVGTIRDLFAENSECQIMVLCHNRSLLTYLYDSIQHKEIATVGYYVGGMKQDKLVETESKQIVLATYAMAAEALDIKTLSVLVMVTPKTDITQSVGRILRVKHKNPIIVDIIDKHDVFQKQWFQRRRYYKKCNYRIRTIESSSYSGMNIDWQNDASWKRVYEPSEKLIKDADADADADIDTPHSSLGASNKGKCMIQIENLDD